MNTSIQFVSVIMIALAVGSFFWVYKTTSSSVYQRRRGDRRASIRPQGYDRRGQTEDAVWNPVEYWAHRIVWFLVAVTSLVIVALNFGPGIGLT